MPSQTYVIFNMCLSSQFSTKLTSHAMFFYKNTTENRSSSACHASLKPSCHKNTKNTWPEWARKQVDTVTSTIQFEYRVQRGYEAQNTVIYL